MQRYLTGILSLCFFLVFSFSTRAQDTTVTSVDPDLLALQNARIAKEYSISSIKITGLTTLDSAIVSSISGIRVGDKVTLPGGDMFSKAIANLWRQRFFSNVQIFITGVQADAISIEINVQERPKLGNFKFIGIKKSEAEELQGKIGLAKQTIITE
ncbi:MAG: outer membrane protein assembly factor, partial [Bacteroidota bacterium]